MHPINLKRISRENNPNEVGKKLKEKISKTAEETFKGNEVCGFGKRKNHSKL